MTFRKKNIPLSPVKPDGMDIIFFYKCPICSKHIAISSPTEPRLALCDNCKTRFPITPVDGHGIQYLRIMLNSGKAATDPDFL